MSFGWGTNLTNDFKDCAPKHNARLEAISLVCKVSEANGRPAVKAVRQSDKATGTPEEIARYMRIFGSDGLGKRAVAV